MIRKERISIKLNLALDNLDSLPAMPDIAHRLLALPLDSESGEKQMLSLIEQDPQIAARIVGLANSPLMGVGRRVSSVHDAAMLLGMKRLKSVSIGIATMSELIKTPASKSFNPHNLWLHSMAVAIAMDHIALMMPNRIQPDQNQIFLSGLLHDIGLMALHHLDFESSDELHHQLCLQPHRFIRELEMELLGLTHCQIGAQLGKHWNLPAEIVEVVEYHHSPRDVDAATANPLVRLANLAEKLLPDFGIAEHTRETIGNDEWIALCIDPARADEIAAVINELAMQVMQLPESYEADAHQKHQVAKPNSEDEDAVGNAYRSFVVVPLKGLASWIGALLH